jgi:hypothetical protein
MKRQIPRIKMPEGYESMSDNELLKLIREGDKDPESVINRVKIMEELYKGTEQRVKAFHEELESEFHAVINKFNLPMDREAIASAGITVDRGQTELVMEGKSFPFSCSNPSATITRHGKPVSRTIRMNDPRINTDCLAPELKQALIKDGVLCEVLDDLKRMTEDATKTLQELLDEPEKPDHNCTEIYVDPVTHKINRVVCLGKEYKG